MQEQFNFEQSLAAFNEMYSLPVNEVPTFINSTRLENLKEILLEEVNEIDAIVAKARNFEAAAKLHRQSIEDKEDIVWENRTNMIVEILTDLSDLMIDLQVYCGSETKKWGIPMEAVQYIVMASNRSKLGADGKPIINEQGKVEKGPHYWKPEPIINELLKLVSLRTDDPMTVARALVQRKQAELAGNT